MPEVTVKLPELPEELEWKRVQRFDYANEHAFYIAFERVPKPAEWVNVRMRRGLADRIVGNPNANYNELVWACREALAEKCGETAGGQFNPCELARGHEGPHA